MPADTLPDAQARILLHTLGLDGRHREPYRNRYVTGAEPVPEIDALVSAGLMAPARRPGFLPADDRVFVVTTEGRAVAQREHRRLYPPPSRARARYLHWLDVSDACGMTFRDYLAQKLYSDPKWGGPDAR